MSRPIRAFVGLNGSGKTLCMVEEMALPAIKEGRPVYSTCRIGSPDDEKWFDGCYPLTTAAQLLDVPEHSAVLIDEVTASFPSRQHAALPPDVQRWSNQLRKKDIEFGWTGPNWRRMDSMLREVTQRVTVCRAMVGSRVVRRASDGRIARYGDDGLYLSAMFGALEGEPGRKVRWPNEWGAYELFRFKTYSADDFDEFNEDQARKRLRPINKKFYWRRRHDGWRSYSTLEPVALLSHLDEFGTCVRCGGTRPRPRCKCASERAAQEERRASADPAPLVDEPAS